MKWCCFLFWFVWRLTLACLAHFNWFMAFYTNCIFFTIWKSYDLLWFWQHLLLCSCFESLRRENYLLVWCNLIRHRRLKYPNATYKQIYLLVYGGKGTKAERALEVLEDKERTERLTRKETRRIQTSRGEEMSSSSEDDDNQAMMDDKKRKKVIHSAGELADREADKYLYVGQAMPSGNSLTRLEEGDDEDGMEMESREEKEEGGGEDSGGEENVDEGTPLHRRVGMRKDREERGDIIISDPVETVSVNSETRWQRMKNFFPRHFPTFNRQYSTGDPNSVDVISPNYRNTYDLVDPKDEKRREKRDRKALTKKLRLRIKEELKIIAIAEKRRKKIANAIELFLQLLRMICSFAILTGNIRKTFVVAHFRCLRPGQKSTDNSELQAFFAFTCFLDTSMFCMNTLWAACLQWHLCCRLGLFKFLLWSALLGGIAFAVMILPVSILMNQLDICWCHFDPNSVLYQFQPKWHW
ncbi:hypothetical protein PENTCL1PPCAC_26522 [Pristionchus entomophagus]|uniref:G protein-coupled receptor n=1 Tax=Pristionchus entomophagus TaxID=358040 RepID=A0AAV5UD86_9BILA|nr:hypothetical protein PENTCL1PPCAC_26522 [Pristionchus entomophagus]